MYSVVFQEICSRYGKTYSWDLKSLVMGKKALEAAQIVIDVLQLPMSKEELVEESQRKLQELFPTAELMPENSPEQEWGDFWAERTGCAVPENEGLELLPEAALGTRDVFKPAAFTLPDDAGRVYSSLPAPLSRSPPHAVQCLVFEDAPNGVEAALTAGMQVVMVPDENLSRDLTTKATVVLSSLQDLQPELFGLPAYE
ncbi:Pseudouridine-5'-monophosphatase [Fukomys damarensis]|uniref:Pseudouridine-5'-monophosphatase n=1 Tax=Fukomys damarensis TaxID=885580 RepID=A0A091CRM5_FUKDA|nr:Pseudouridine-5'-monophosphatase [Fukomys damarensis]